MKCPITNFVFLASLLCFASVTNAQVGASTSYAQTTINQPTVVKTVTYNGSFFDKVVLTDNCTAALNADGTVSVVPDRDFVGVASVNYTVCADATRKDCACGLVTVQVNDNPTPYYDNSIVYTEKNQKSIFTIPNAFAFDGQIATPHGVLSVNANGVVAYRPATGFSGIDNYIFDSPDGKSHYEVTFEVFALKVKNTFAIDDTISIKPNGTFQYNLLQNDKLNNVSNITPTPSDFQHCYVTSVTNGVVNIVAEKGYAGLASFKYTLTNNNGLTETATVHITISNFDPSKAVYELTVPASAKYIFNYDNLNAGDGATFKVISNANSNGDNLSFYNNLDTVLNGSFQPLKNVFVFTPAPNSIGSDFNLVYCKNSNCSEYKYVQLVFHTVNNATCSNKCLFPGDANNDGTVNMLDLFPIAANMGTYGTARSDANVLNWYGRTTSDWAKEDVSSSDAHLNLKFADTNGDGIISADDTSAVSLNYGNTSRLSAQTYTENSDVSLQLLSPVGSVHTGDMVEITLSVGSIEQPVYNSKGLSFSVNYDSKRIKENSIQVNFNKFSWLSHNNPYLTLSKVVQRGTIDAGLVRSQNLGSTGHGEIGKIRGVVIEDVAGISQGNNPTVRFSVGDIYVEDANGNASLIKGGSIEIPILPKATNTVLQNSDLHVYPNPANTTANFYLNGDNALNSVRLVDLSGKTISEFSNINSKQFTIPLSGMSNGLYILDVKTDKGRITQKLQVSE